MVKGRGQQIWFWTLSQDGEAAEGRGWKISGIKGQPGTFGGKTKPEQSFDPAKAIGPKDEIERYKNHFDPIQLWKNRLIEESVLTEADCETIDKAAKAEAQASADFSLASPFPEFEDITKDVYYEVDEFTEAGRTGRHFFND